MTNLQEIWVPIPNYEGLYEVSNFGTVRSLTRTVKIGPNFRTIESQVLKPMFNRGYYQIIVCKNSKHKTLKPHRLVAQLFIPNPQNKPEVNHRDANKLNNRVDNLEWNTSQENSLHSVKLGLRIVTEKSREAARRNSKLTPKGINAKKVIDIATGHIFSSVGEAAKSLGMRGATLSRKLVGTRKNDTSFLFL